MFSAVDYLAVSIDNRPQQFPGSSTAVHANHAEDLEEAETSDG